MLSLEQIDFLLALLSSPGVQITMPSVPIAAATIAELQRQRTALAPSK